MNRNGSGKVRGTGRATLEEVAQLAGVSTMTASRALSQPQLVSEMTRTKVEKAVAELPEKCRLIFRLSREEHLSHKEIAERLQISPKTVENQLTIALRRLRHFLEDYAYVFFFFLTPFF